MGSTMTHGTAPEGLRVKHAFARALSGRLRLWHRRLAFYLFGLAAVVPFFDPHRLLVLITTVIAIEILERGASWIALRRRAALLGRNAPRMRQVAVIGAFSVLHSLPVMTSVTLIWFAEPGGYNVLCCGLLATGGLYAAIHTRQIPWAAKMRQALYVVTALALMGSDIARDWGALTLAHYTQPLGALIFGFALFFLAIWIDAAMDARERSLAAERSQRSAAEQASAEKSRFLAVMSHEIRTPLNGMLGMAQLLEQSRLDPDQAKKVSVLIESGRSLVQILNEVLDYAALERGPPEIRYEETDLRAVLEGASAPFAAEAASRGIALTVEVEPGVPGALIMDPYRVRQCVSNLVSNALRFTAEGSVSVRAGGFGRWLSISVTDTGRGVPEAEAERIFEPYVQGDGGAEGRRGGTGLGLAISREYARAMNGELRLARGGQGAGATFTLSLPMLAVEAKPESKPGQRRAERREARRAARKGLAVGE